MNNKNFLSNKFKSGIIISSLSAFTMNILPNISTYANSILDLDVDMPDVADTIVGDTVVFIFSTIGWLGVVATGFMLIWLILAFRNKDADAQMQAGIGAAVSVAISIVAHAIAAFL